MRYPSAATASQCYEFDIIICATGFDAITGAFDRIDIRGVDGVRLKEVWKDGPQTYLGVFIERFPNLLMAMGPHAGLGNYTRTAEYSVEWVTGIIQFATERGLTRVEATAAGVAEWTDHVLALGQLMNEIGSWMLAISGVAAAIPHDPGLLLALDIAVTPVTISI